MPHIRIGNFFFGSTVRSRPRPPHIEVSRSHSDKPQSEGLLCMSDQLDARDPPYLTTHNTHKRQTSIPPVGIEHSTPASERPQTHTLDHEATGITIEANTIQKCQAKSVSNSYKLFSCVKVNIELSLQ